MVEIDVVESPEQPTVGLREKVPMDALPAFFDRAFHVTYQAVEAAGGQVAGPPYARYFGRPTETVDVEAGFPVAAPTAVEAPAVAGALPAGRVVQALHVGPYDQLAQTYQAVESWMSERDMAPGDDMWEVYLSDPSAEPDPATWRTRIVVPVVSS